MHTAAAMNYTVLGCRQVARLDPGDAILGVVPLGSAPGFTFTAHFSLALGHPLVIIDPWDALETLKLIELHQVRWGICVPTHLASLVEVARSGRWSLGTSPIKALGVGGSSMTPELIDDAHALLGIRALRMFGMMPFNFWAPWETPMANTRKGTRIEKGSSPYPSVTTMLVSPNTALEGGLERQRQPASVAQVPVAAR